MSFQAYLDAVETKTGLTPRQLLEIAASKGFDATTKAGPILTWLADDYGLGRGHGMAMVQVIHKGMSATAEPMWLDGKDSKPVT